MEINYEPNKNRIINNCIAALDNPKIIIVDSQSSGYLKNRELADVNLERKLLTSCVDNAAYYDELMK